MEQEEILYFSLISKFFILVFFSISSTVFTSCSTRHRNIKEHDPILHGNITYPFAVAPPSIGKNIPKKDFVIRSQKGGTMYQVAIPGEARDFNVEVPLAEMSPDQSYISKTPEGSSMTDRELVSHLPSIDKSFRDQTSQTDQAFGVTPSKSMRQGPSYTMGLSEVKHFFKQRKYEVALVKVNHLLSFYPNSPKLYKMKGTVLRKLGSHELALHSWKKALELSPNDRTLKVGIKRLQSLYFEKRTVDHSSPSTNAFENSTNSESSPLEGAELHEWAH